MRCIINSASINMPIYNFNYTMESDVSDYWECQITGFAVTLFAFIFIVFIIWCCWCSHHLCEETNHTKTPDISKLKQLPIKVDSHC